MKKNTFNSLLTISSISCFTPALASCSADSKIVLANFESYMSTDLIDKYGSKVNFLYYQTNEEIESKYHKYYDLAIPSTYEVLTLLKNKWVQKIDWSIFDLYDANNNKITNGVEALSLFTDSIQHIIEQITIKYSNLFASGENLLDYCIPYFLQSFTFAYKGEEVPEFANTTNWEEYTDLIGDKTNPNLPDVFIPNKTSRIGCVDDGRTFYGLCNLIKNQKLYPDDPKKWNINPDDETKSINGFKNDYQYLTNKFSPNHFYFNTDSQVILQSLSAPIGGNLSSFAYNGDILYAAMGAELYDPYGPENFHIEELDAKPLALDALVINNKNSNNPQKLNEIYNFVKSMFLDHIDSNEISNVDENGDFLYDPMTNFDFVRYTSPFKSIDDYVLNGSYFLDVDETFTDGQVQLYKDIYNININPKVDIINLIEEPLSDLCKSNMHWAYVEEKQKI